MPNTQPNKTSIVFFGTPPIAALTLKSLVKAGFVVTAVVTEPDKPAGRGLKVNASAVKQMATELDLPIFQPQSKNELTTLVDKLSADLGVIIAYGQIIPPAVIEHFPEGILNIHGSLLPAYRGAAPIQRAIWDGLTETGVTIQQIDAGLDTGPIVAQTKIKLDPRETTTTLMHRMGLIGTKLLIKSIPDYMSGKLKPTPQAGSPSYATKLTKEDGRIDWQQSAEQIERQIRACNPWPGTYTDWHGQRLIIREAEIQDGKLQPKLVQPEGKPVMPWKAWLNGQHLTSAEALDQIRVC